MKTPSSLVPLLASLSILAACSSTSSTVPAEVTIDPSVARTQASALTAAVTSASSNDGLAIAETIASAANTAAALTPPTRDASRGQIARAHVATTCACAKGATSCTFAGCTIDRATVNGTISWGNGTITCDKLNVAVPQASAQVGAVNVTVDCSFTYTSNSLAGTLHTTGEARVQGVDYTWDATIAVNDVTFTKSALTGGSVDVEASVTGSSTQRGSESYVGSAIVTLP